LVNTAPQAGNEQDIETVQFRVQTDRNRHAAALDAGEGELTCELRSAELLQLLADDRIVGYQDLRLVDRDIERLRIRHLRPNQALVLRQIVEMSANRHDVARLQRESAGGPEGLIATFNVDDFVLRVLLQELVNRAAEQFLVSQLVGASGHRTIAGQANVVD